MFFIHSLSAQVTTPLAAGEDSGLTTEEELVAAAQADPRAFTPLYERYLDRIYRFCYNRLGDRQAAEDATSEVFLHALAHLGAYHSGNFAAWLYTIARNSVIAHYRRQGRSEPLADAQAAEAAHDPLAGHAERTALLLALDQLSDEQRAAVEMPAAGWSDAQIGAILGKSEAAVRMIRYRALQRLQTLLADDPSGDRIAGDRR
jgi:RNA polymerase sigma-70 factor (ECF subfamily)